MRSPRLRCATSLPTSMTSAGKSSPKICGSVAAVNACGLTDVTIRPGDVFVQIGSADAGPEQLHEELIGPKSFGSFDSINADVPCTRNSEQPSLIDPSPVVRSSNARHQRARVWGRGFRALGCTQLATLTNGKPGPVRATIVWIYHHWGIFYPNELLKVGNSAVA